MTKYRHVTNVTLGDQLKTQNGTRLHAEEKVQLCDSCFTQYRAFNEEQRCREIGCRERGFSVPFDDILIKVCQKHMRTHVIKTSQSNKSFKQQDVYIQDKEGNFVRMDANVPPIPADQMGDGIGLSRRENAWRDQQVRGTGSVSDKENACVTDHSQDYLDDTSSLGEQTRTPRARISQQSAPELRRPRDKSFQSRVSSKSEPARASVPPRTPKKKSFPSEEESDESETSDATESCSWPEGSCW